MIGRLRSPHRGRGTIDGARSGVRHAVARRAVTAIATGAIFVATASACGSSGSAPARAGSCLASPGTVAAGSAAGVTATRLPTASASSVTAATKMRVPSQSVDCLDGSGVVQLDTLARPAVINLWASYCLPCHAELPRLEAFARAAGSSLAVIGVDTADERGAAVSVVHDLGLTYPMVFDPKQLVYTATAGRGLPATLFVAPGGAVRSTSGSSLSPV